MRARKKNIFPMLPDSPDVERKYNALPQFQKEQVNAHIASYMQQLYSQKPPVNASTIATLVSQFKSTIVNSLSKKAEQMKIPQKPHPLSIQPTSIPIIPAQPSATHAIYAMTATAFPVHIAHPAPPMQHKPIPKPMIAPTNQETMEFSIGGQKRRLPVTLKEWIVRLYTALPYGDTDLRVKADKYVEQLVGKALNSGTVMTTDWRFFPVPTPMDIALMGHHHKPISVPLHDTRQSYGDPARDFIPMNSKMNMLSKKAPKTDKSVKLTRQPPAPNRVTINPASHIDSEEVARREARAAKYKDQLEPSMLQVDTKGEHDLHQIRTEVRYEFGDDAEDVFDKTDKFKVVGKCETTEKSYFRLTSAPDPNLVRPEPILAIHMKNMQNAVLNQSKEYKWLSDQVRAVRQDMTVQGIKNQFACDVYEWNARLALENDDIGQFNQCQTQLKELHGDSTPVDIRSEFLAYGLIYFVLQGMRVDQQRFMAKLADLPAIVKQHPYVMFALKFREAFAVGNFSKIFQLFSDAVKGSVNAEPSAPAVASPTKGRKKKGSPTKPSMQTIQPPSHAHFLIRNFILGLRLDALLQLTKAFVSAPVEWLRQILGFQDVAECTDFFKSKEFFVFKTDGSTLDCKATQMRLKDHPALSSQKSKIMG